MNNHVMGMKNKICRMNPLIGKELKENIQRGILKVPLEDLFLVDFSLFVWCKHCVHI
jgi:hypothetical protein